MSGTITIAERIAARTVLGVEHVLGLGECWEWQGMHNDDGYALINVGTSPERRLRVHRLVFEAEHGVISPGMLVDHRCHNRGCVRGSHLRELTHAQNCENRAGAQRNSESGVRGVSFSRGRFVVQASKAGTRHYGGVFTDIADAERAAVALREQIGMTS